MEFLRGEMTAVINEGPIREPEVSLSNGALVTMTMSALCLGVEF